MNEKGKMRFKWELEKFVVTRLRPFLEPPYIYDYIGAENILLDEESRFRFMDDWWGWNEYRYRNSWGELVDFPQLTNHEICHEMFWNAFRGRSKMYIQIQDLRFDETLFPNNPDKNADDNIIKGEDENNVITLQCSLLTLQMLDYDIMLFRAMSDREDEEYRRAAQQHYRPYLFSYVVEVNEEKYNKLKELQKNLVGLQSNEEDEPSPYLWLACTFNPDINVPHIDLAGYVVQSASSINKIRADLHIIEDEKTPKQIIKSILKGYKLSDSCLEDDDLFVGLIENKLKNNHLSTIDVYKIGNGNCVFAQGVDNDVSFFYDIGFNYKHRPQKIVPGVSYSYIDTMKRIYAQNPSFFILSHWDMDHIAGSAAARKELLDKDWFAPDCYDACMDAKRLAKYLDLKSHLHLAKRPSKEGTLSGRLIGHPIYIYSTTSPSKKLAIYTLYMGEKETCDRSNPNCEGIVIEYTDIEKEKNVLMMGDVNYASFNKALINNGNTFADTQIDYLIVPHHGSEHTDYTKITDPAKTAKKGTQAIICCTNEPESNRPNDTHRKELEKRFGDNVITTEEALPKNNSIKITL